MDKRNLLFKRICGVIALSGLALLFLAACGTGETRLPTFTPPPSPPPAPSATPFPTAVTLPAPATLPPEATFAALGGPELVDPALLQVVQANLSLPAIDFYLNGRLVAARFRPRTFSGRPVAVAYGASSLRLVTAGAQNTLENTLLETPLTLEANQHAILLVYGDAQSIQVTLIPQDLSPLLPNTTRLRVVNAVAGGPTFEVRAGETILSENLNLGEASPYRTFTAEPLRLRVGLAGGAPLFFSDENLIAQRAYTALVVGDASQGRYESLLLSDSTPPQALVRFFHAAADAPPVRVVLGGQTILEALDFGLQAEESILTLDAGTFPLEIQSLNAVTGETPLYRGTLALSPNTLYEAVLYGTFVDLRLGLYPVDSRPVTAEQARLNIIHAAPAYPALQVVVPNALNESITNPEVQTDFDLTFGGQTQPRLVSSGESTLGVANFDLDGTSRALFSTPILFEGGVAYTWVVTEGNEAAAFLLSAPLPITRRAELEDVLSAAENTEIRFVNLLRGNVTVRITYEEERLAESLAFSEATSFLQVLPDIAQRLRVEDTTGAVLLERTFTARAGARLSLHLMGTPSAPEIFISTDPMEANLSGTGRVRILNAMYETGKITLNYALAQERVDDVLSDPLAAPTPISEVRDLGTTFEIGDAVVTDFNQAAYVLNVYDGLTGERLQQLYFEVEAEQFLDLYLFESGGQFALVQVKRPLETLGD